MGFTDHGIPTNSAEFLGNGAGGMALLPKGLQHLDTFGRPDHIHCGTLNMLWASHYAPTRGSKQEENRDCIHSRQIGGEEATLKRKQDILNETAHIVEDCKDGLTVKPDTAKRYVERRLEICFEFSTRRCGEEL